MNQQNSKLPTSRIKGMYRQWALICFILSTVAASLVFALAYNARTGYINSTAAGISLATLVFGELVLSAIISRSAPIYINEGNRKALHRVITLLLHITVIFCGVMAASGCTDAIFSIDAVQNANQNAILPSYILRGVLAAAAVIAFLASPALHKEKSNNSIPSQINGYSIIFFCIIGIGILYFDMSVEMNNPQKLYLQFALASICLSELYDTKSCILGKGNRLSTFFKLASISIAPIAAISTLITFAEKGKSFPAAYLYFAIVTGVYALAYTLKIIFPKSKEYPPCKTP